MNLVITVPADVLAPNGARPTAHTLLATMIDDITLSLQLLQIWNTFFLKKNYPKGLRRYGGNFSIKIASNCWWKWQYPGPPEIFLISSLMSKYAASWGLAQTGGRFKLNQNRLHMKNIITFHNSAFYHNRISKLAISSTTISKLMYLYKSRKINYISQWIYCFSIVCAVLHGKYGLPHRFHWYKTQNTPFPNGWIKSSYQLLGKGTFVLNYIKTIWTRLASVEKNPPISTIRIHKLDT